MVLRITALNRAIHSGANCFVAGVDFGNRPEHRPVLAPMDVFEHDGFERIDNGQNLRARADPVVIQCIG